MKTIVNPKLDRLAFKALNGIGKSIICACGSPVYDYVDELAEAQVLPRYPDLMHALVKKSHSSAGGIAQHYSPHHRRAIPAIFSCQSLGWYWLNQLDKRIVEAGTPPTRTPVCEGCRIRIAEHPDASPALWKDMVTRRSFGEGSIYATRTRRIVLYYWRKVVRITQFQHKHSRG
jgi:hypothetical protein